MNDLNRTKQTIYVIGALLLFVLAGFLLYELSSSKKQATSQRNQGGVTGGGSNLPSGGGESEVTKKITEAKPGEEIAVNEEVTLLKIADFPVISPSLDPSGKKILYYKKDGGDLYVSDFNGASQEKISNITIVGLIEALWSPKKDRAAVFYLDEETMKGFIHIGTSSVATLPQNIESFSWSPDGGALSYTQKIDGILTLFSADSSGRNPRIIYRTPILDAVARWITPEKLALITAPSGRAGGYLFLYNRSSGGFGRISGPLFGLDAVWSPDGTKAFLSWSDSRGKGISSSIINQKGEDLVLEGPKTLARKCVFADSKTLYCAVPNFLLPGWTLPDDYLRGEANTADHLVRVAAASGAAEELFRGGEFDMSDLLLTKDEKTFFFVDRRDGTLWRLKLK